MRRLILLLLSLNQMWGFAQSKIPNAFYFQPKGGILMAHRPSMTHLVRENTYGFEIGTILFRQHTHLDSAYHFPAMGFNAEFRNFGYDKVLGYGVSVGHFFNVPIYQSNHLFIDFQYGSGLGYLTKKYNKDTNPTNIAIGSHFNAKVNFKLLATYYFETFYFGAGLEMNHFSNGAITRPNLGLNSANLLVNFGYSFVKRQAFQAIKNKKEINNQRSIMLEGLATLVQIGANPYDPKRYPVIALRTTLKQTISWNWDAELSLDLVHNEANLNVYQDTTFTRKDVLQIGLYAGAAYRFYKSEITMGIGYYLRDNINVLGKLYNKVGYRYFFNTNWFGIFNVKANLGRADYFEFGVGVKFK